MCAETEDASVLRIIDRMPAIQLALQVNTFIRQALTDNTLHNTFIFRGFEAKQFMCSLRM